MCGLCGVLGVQDHWSDHADGSRGPPDRGERTHRLNIARKMLSPFGLSLREWQGRYVVSSGTGKSDVIEHLGLLWQSAEKLTGRRCDPLDPGYLDRF